MLPTWSWKGIKNQHTPTHLTTCREGGEPGAAPCPHPVVLGGRKPNLPTQVGGMEQTDIWTHTHIHTYMLSLMRRRCALLSGARHSRTMGAEESGLGGCTVIVKKKKKAAGCFSLYHLYPNEMAVTELNYHNPNKHKHMIMTPSSSSCGSCNKCQNIIK